MIYILEISFFVIIYHLASSHFSVLLLKADTGYFLKHFIPHKPLLELE